MIEQWEPEALQTALREGRALTVLDVREEEELALAALPGVLHIPLGDLVQRAEEVPRNLPVVVICHHGIRSQSAAGYLESRGWRAHNLRGGIDAWSRRVDPRIPRY